MQWFDKVSNGLTHRFFPDVKPKTDKLNGEGNVDVGAGDVAADRDARSVQSAKQPQHSRRALASSVPDPAQVQNEARITLRHMLRKAQKSGRMDEVESIQAQLQALEAL